MGSNSRLGDSTREDEDRISKLPDNILHRILSFLPANYAVRTSVLSSSWRNHWKSIDTIDIDFHYFRTPKSAHKVFVQVLENCESSNIRKFRLCYHHYSLKNLLLFRDFVDAALNRNVQELELEVYRFKSLRNFPPEFFTCKSLKVLKLSDYVSPVPPLVNRFPNLKVLHVCLSSTPAHDFCERFFSGCPQLEDLRIVARPKANKNLCFKISAPLLKKLVIIFPEELGDTKHQVSYKFEVNASGLEYLHLEEYSMSCTLVGSFPNVESVTLNLGSIDVLQASKKDAQAIAKVLKDVVNTKSLSLSFDTTNGLLGFLVAQGLLPSLHNLTCLSVTLHDYITCIMLYSLLTASPKLQTLTLQMINKGEEGELSKPLAWPSYASDYEVPDCLSQELMAVTIRFFRGLLVEIHVISIFLKNAKALRKMTIYAEHSDVKEKFAKELMDLPRASKTCHVEII